MFAYISVCMHIVLIPRESPTEITIFSPQLLLSHKPKMEKAINEWPLLFYKWNKRQERLSILYYLGSLLLAWNTRTKATCRGKSLFGWCFHITVHHWNKSGQALKQGRNLEAAADAETMKNVLHRLVPHELLSLLSYGTHGHQHSDGTTHSGLDLPTSITS